MDYVLYLHIYDFFQIFFIDCRRMEVSEDKGLIFFKLQQICRHPEILSMSRLFWILRNDEAMTSGFLMM